MTQSIPFVFLGDKSKAAKAVTFYKSLGAHIEAEVYADTKAMQNEWNLAPGALFHCETYWGTANSAPVYMSASPFEKESVGQVLLVFANTAAGRRRVEELTHGLARGGEMVYNMAHKSWGVHTYIIDQFGIHWHLTYDDTPKV